MTWATQQLTQLSRTYEVAQQRLDDMDPQQRDELEEAIDELKEQMKWGAEMIASLQEQKNAAE